MAHAHGVVAGVDIGGGALADAGAGAVLPYLIWPEGTLEWALASKCIRKHHTHANLTSIILYLFSPAVKWYVLGEVL